jgi:putative intracellular protease/amidase
MVLTSTTTMGATDEPTGIWLSEFTEPYYALLDGDLKVDVVSVRGGRVPIDPRSATDEACQDPPNARYASDVKAQAQLSDTVGVDQVDFGRYDAIFIPGGHGTMWDMPDSEPLGQGVSRLLAEGKPVAAVCHGPAGLLSAKTEAGAPVIRGRTVSAFTRAEEEKIGLEKKVPFFLDERLEELGADVKRGDPFTETAVADGNLITGQNPQSAGKVARLLMNCLAAAQR